MTTTWTDWAAVQGYSGFKVESSDGRVSMAQASPKNFSVTTRFVFADADTLDKLQQSVTANGHPEIEARAMVDDARGFGGDGEMTDLASVPQFMAWFERAYGRHTLAAMIHDRLITDGKLTPGRLAATPCPTASFAT